MPPKTLLLILLAILLPMLAIAQKKNKSKEQTVYICGQVADSFTKTATDAFITLRNADSTVVDTMTTGDYLPGRFAIKVPRRDSLYIVTAEAKGYHAASVEYKLKIKGHKPEYYVPNIHLKRKVDDIYKDVNLDGVVVEGTRIQVAYRGDTIVYNAAAFRLPEGSMLDALIKQLPGAELKDNGTILVNGKKVDYMMLNGKDFFKGDNKVMLENLPYFTVKDLKVYSKLSDLDEMRGRQSERKDYVMDVTLKREYNNGYVVNSEVGAGSDNRWLAKLFGLYYDDYVRTSIYGNANNVNENRTPGSNGDWNPSKVSSGRLTTKQTGIQINYNGKDNKVRNDFSTSLKWDDTDKEQHKATETFASGGNILSGNTLLSRDDNFKLSMTDRLILRDQGIYFNGSLNYNNNRTWTEASDSTFSSNALTNKSGVLGMLHNKSLDAGGYFNKIFKLSWGDNINLTLSGYYMKSDPNTNQDVKRTLYGNTGETKLSNNYTDASSMVYNYSASVAYNRYLPKQWEFSPSVGYGQTYQENTNSLYRLDLLRDAADNSFTDLGLLPQSADSLALAFDEGNSYRQRMFNKDVNVNLNFQRSTRKSWFYLSLPLSFVYEKMNYSRASIDTLLSRHYMDFSPRLEYETYGKNKYNLSYSCDIRRPDLSNQVPTVTDSDPLATFISNPNLKTFVTHKLSARANFHNDSTDISYWVQGKANIGTKGWGMRTTYNSTTGAYTYMQDNVSGNWDASLSSGLNGTLGKKKRISYSADASLTYNRSVDYDVAYDTDADVLSKVNNLYWTLHTNWKYRRGDFSAGIVGRMTARHISGTREDVDGLSTFDFKYGCNVQYTIPVLRLTLASDITMYSNRGYQSSVMNTDDLVWNAQFSHSLLKGRCTLKLIAFDILHQLSSKRYSMNAQGRTETWYNSLPRYLMFSLAYKISKKPKKK